MTLLKQDLIFNDTVLYFSISAAQTFAADPNVMLAYFKIDTSSAQTIEVCLFVCLFGCLATLFVEPNFSYIQNNTYTDFLLPGEFPYINSSFFIYAGILYIYDARCV